MSARWLSLPEFLRDAHGDPDKAQILLLVAWVVVGGLLLWGYVIDRGRIIRGRLNVEAVHAATAMPDASNPADRGLFSFTAMMAALLWLACGAGIRAYHARVKDMTVAAMSAQKEFAAELKFQEIRQTNLRDITRDLATELAYPVITEEGRRKFLSIVRTLPRFPVVIKAHATPRSLYQARALRDLMFSSGILAMVDLGGFLPPGTKRYKFDATGAPPEYGLSPPVKSFLDAFRTAGIPLAPEFSVGTDPALPELYIRIPEDLPPP